MEKLLTQKQVAFQLGISERTLERHRVTGTGPRWARIGRLVRYRLSDLEQWVENSLRTSTSEPQLGQRSRERGWSSGGTRPRSNQGKSRLSSRAAVAVSDPEPRP